MKIDKANREAVRTAPSLPGSGYGELGAPGGSLARGDLDSEAREICEGMAGEPERIQRGQESG